MNAKDMILYGTVAVATFGATWTFAEVFGFRPALIRELDAVRNDVEVVGKSVAWLQFDQYEARIKRGVKLSREECARYHALARLLGVKNPLSC